jgi:hypothetical protein
VQEAARAVRLQIKVLKASTSGKINAAFTLGQGPRLKAGDVGQGTVPGLLG